MEILKYLKNYGVSGTLMSSSTSSINKLINEINPNKPQTIIELGGGAGKTTRHILSRMHSEAVLHCFEIQPHFIAGLKQINDPRFHLIHDSATNILNHLPENSADIIVSTLPLSFFKSAMRTELLQHCNSVLKQEGIFRQLSFLFFPHYFNNVFDIVNTELKIIDMPPAILYFCTKSYTS